MRVAYIHFSDPDVVKIHDTVKAHRNTGCFTGKPLTQAEFDTFTRKKLKDDMDSGYILFYEFLDNKPAKKVVAENDSKHLQPCRRLVKSRGFMWFVFDVKAQHICILDKFLKSFDTKADCQKAIDEFYTAH